MGVDSSRVFLKNCLKRISSEQLSPSVTVCLSWRNICCEFGGNQLKNILNDK